jgi:hypothetical protein
VTCSQSEVLQIVVDEFQNLSPETTVVFIFKKYGETVATNQVTTEDQTRTVIANFSNLTLQNDIIGSLENLTIRGANGQLSITTMDDLYLATVSSKKTNPKIINSLTHVLVPTIVKLLDQQSTENHQEVPQPPQILPENEVSVEEPVFSHEEPELEPVSEIESLADPLLPKQPIDENLSEKEEVVEEAEFSQEESEMESVCEPQSPMEPLLPNQPINQLMIEKIKGILVPADTVRVDSEVIESWTELYGNRELLINVQTLDGKETTCKFKPVKEGKSNSKGIIQIPEKILKTLQASNGQLVMVKPIID